MSRIRQFKDSTKTILAGITMCYLAVVNPVSAATLTNSGKVIGDTKSVEGWMSAMEKPKPALLSLVPGPSGVKTLQLDYNFGDNNVWIALIKEKLSFSFAKGQALRFSYSGSGASANVRLKVYDDKGTVFGYTLPGGSSTSPWQEVIAARKDFQYLWGGTGASDMDWNHLIKFEVTLDRDSLPGVKYKVNISKPGKIAFTDFILINNDNNATPNPEIFDRTKGTKKGKEYQIDPMSDAGIWVGLADKDGTCRLSGVATNIQQTPVQAMAVDFDFAGGTWIAVGRPINLDLGSMKKIKFQFTGRGGKYRLVFKLMDSNKRVYGSPVTDSIDTEGEWQTVQITRDSFSFLYGGPEPQNTEPPDLDFRDIKRVEFTIEKQAEADTQGTLVICNLGYR